MATVTKAFALCCRAPSDAVSSQLISVWVKLKRSAVKDGGENVEQRLARSDKEMFFWFYYFVCFFTPAVIPLILPFFLWCCCVYFNIAVICISFCTGWLAKKWNVILQMLAGCDLYRECLVILVVKLFSWRMCHGIHVCSSLCTCLCHHIYINQ